MKCLWLLLVVPTLTTAQSLVMIGGGLSEDNEIIFGKMMELAGGPGAKIGIITTASPDPTSEATKLLSLFAGFGANGTWIPITTSSNNVDDPAMAALIQQQDGLFFCGGARSRVVRTFRPNGVDTLALTTIRQKLRNGLMLAGTSAGAATQGSRVVQLTGEVYETMARKNYTISQDGLGTFEGNYMTDGHCSEYGREARLIRVLQETRDLPLIGTTKGISIDEDTALVVTGLYSGRPLGTVIGKTGGVKIFDVSDMISRPSSTVDYVGAKMSSLSVDDTIDINTGEITIASWKRPLAGEEIYSNASSSSDIFSTNTIGQWRDAANRLVDNKVDQTVRSVTFETNPQFEVVFNRSQATAYGANLPNDRGSFVYSYLNVLVNMRGYFENE